MCKININSKVLTIILGLYLITGSAGVYGQHEHHSDMPEERKPSEKTQQKKDETTRTLTETPAIDSQKKFEPEKTIQAPEISLADLERSALENNPTLKQADSSIRAAEGRKIQAGLFPNPVVGLTAEDLSFRSLGNGGKIGFFVEQRIPLGGKLAKSRRTFAQDVFLAEAAREEQRQRVLNSVRLLYTEALGAQTAADLKKDIAKLAGESAEISGELYNVGLADRPDQLKADILKSRAEAEYFEALNRYEEAWRKLGAMIGKPDIVPSRLAGNMTDLLGEINSEGLLTNLLEESPEIKAARVKVERAKRALTRARAEKAPDLYLRGGVAYNNEIIGETPFKRRAGAEGFLEVGVTLPIFNRNQGGIKTAEAELGSAEREVERLRLALRTRYAEVLRNYRAASFSADRYRTQIVPKAKAAYEMYSVNFQNMTAPYTSVLSTRAAYLQAQIEYARNLTAARQAIVLLKGFLLTGGLGAPDATEPDASGAFRVPAENLVNGDSEDQE